MSDDMTQILIDLDDIPSTLKQMREGARMTQAEAAGASGFCVTSICMWEKGRREPRWYALKQLAAIYGCTVSIAVSIEPIDTTANIG